MIFLRSVTFRCILHLYFLEHPPENHRSVVGGFFLIYHLIITAIYYYLEDQRGAIV